MIPRAGCRQRDHPARVQPQAIGQVSATGTKRPDKVLAEAPSLKAGAVPNFHDVQKDIIALNGVASRKVTPR